MPYFLWVQMESMIVPTPHILGGLSEVIHIKPYCQATIYTVTLPWPWRPYFPFPQWSGGNQFSHQAQGHFCAVFTPSAAESTGLREWFSITC